MRVELPYSPTARQLAFHQSQEDEVLYGGAAGGGKSCAIVMDALLRCAAHPRTVAYLFRRTYRELEDTLIAEALSRVPRALGRYSPAAHELRLVNGSILRFRHCQNDRDRFLYQGAEIHWLYLDELTHFSQTVYDFLRSRLRANASLGIRPVVRAASNPGGVGHAWVKARFIDPMPPDTPRTERVQADGVSGARTLRYIPARVKDNPHLSPGYALELASKPPALRDALLFGRWDAFEGQVFTEWRDDAAGYETGRFTHVVAPFPIPASWRRFRSFDFGYSKPFSVGWWALDPHGVLYRYREWYGCTGTPNVGLRLTPAEIAREIARSERAHEQGLHVTGVADPSIWDGSRGESIAQQMQREGVYFLPAENARLAGLMQVHRRLSFDENGLSGVKVFSTCRDSIRTLPALCYDAQHCEDVDTDAEDHIYDEWRYLFMEHPLPSAARPAAKRGYSPLD
jgi:hypothetical protein